MAARAEELGARRLDFSSSQVGIAETASEVTDSRTEATTGNDACSFSASSPGMRELAALFSDDQVIDGDGQYLLVCFFVTSLLPSQTSAKARSDNSS